MALRGDSDLYVGFDESNHGKYPEIIVTTFSRDPSYILEKTIPKQRVHKSSFLETLPCDYTFLLNSSCWRDVDYNEHLSRIVGSLIRPKIYLHDHIHLYIDGELKRSSQKDVDSLRKNISDIAQIPKSRLTLKYGADFDRTYPLVNIADEIAHYIFRKLTPEKIAQNSHLVKLAA